MVEIGRELGASGRSASGIGCIDMTLDANIQQYINEASERFGVSNQLMSTIAQIESGGNPNAQSRLSSAGGLFQFTDGTAAQYGLANKFDPQASSNAAAQLLSDNYRSLSSALGTAPADWQQYLAYQQGVGGAKALLSADPGDNAIQTLIRAGVSPNIATQSVVNNLGSNFGGNPASATVGDFLGYWQQTYEKKASGSAGTGTYKPAGIVQSLLGNETQAQRDAYNAQRDASSKTGGVFADLINWITQSAARVALVLLGLVLILGGIYLFPTQAREVVRTVKPNA